MTQEIIVYRSPLEKMLTDFLVQHSGALLVMYILFGLFFLLVLAGVATVFWKVFRAHREMERRRRTGLWQM